MLDKTLQEKVGKRIQFLRLQRNLSQQDLAARCDFEKSNMSRLEAGKVNCTLSTINKITNALEIEVEELFKF
jgi:transcriptional regulator with XRE-family HTH domain